jgi:hypothetical protein
MQKRAWVGACISLTICVALATGTRAAGEGEAGPEGKVMTLVGDLAHVEPQSQTVVVEVPIEEQVVTVGAWGVADTTLTSRGQSIGFADLQPGSRVRITVRRVTHGDELLSLEVLQAPAG